MSVGSETSGERRDIQLAVEHWQRNTWGPDSIPLLDTFDFAPLRERWGHWFLICGDHSIESAVFVGYGAGFAQLLGLARDPATDLPCRFRCLTDPCFPQATTERAARHRR